MMAFDFHFSLLYRITDIVEAEIQPNGTAHQIADCPIKKASTYANITLVERLVSVLVRKNFISPLPLRTPFVITISPIKK